LGSIASGVFLMCFGFGFGFALKWLAFVLGGTVAKATFLSVSIK